MGIDRLHIYTHAMQCIEVWVDGAKHVAFTLGWLSSPNRIDVLCKCLFLSFASQLSHSCRYLSQHRYVLNIGLDTYQSYIIV